MDEFEKSTFSSTEISLLLDEIKVGLMLVENDNRIAYANTWFQEACGRTQDALRGATLETVFPMLSSGRLMGAVDEALNAQRSTLLTNKLNKNLFPLRCSSGPEMQQRVTIRPFGAARCLIQIEDVTDTYEREKILKRKRKETETDRAYLDAILQGTAEGIVTIDAQGLIETFNTAAEQIFGYSAPEVVGQNVSILMPLEERGGHDNYLKNSVLHEPRIINNAREITGQRKLGNKFPMELNVSRAELAERVVFIGIIRDITKQKEVERLKTEFVSTVSHELRTPLTSIKGALALLATGAFGGLPEDGMDLIKIAEKNSQRLIVLVNDILDMEKLESGEIEFEMQPLNLSKLISEAVEVNDGFAKQYEVKFNNSPCDGDLTVVGDESRLTQVLANFLSNAAKFSMIGMTIEIYVERYEDAARVMIKDQGPGIPEEFQDSLFDRFTQVDGSDTRKKGGSGLGLNISKLIVEKHGGDIGFSSEVGVGSIFYFTLPTV